MVLSVAARFQENHIPLSQAWVLYKVCQPKAKRKEGQMFWRQREACSIEPTNLILGRVSNLRKVTTSNTQGSRLKPDLESSTSSYPITASSEDEEKQLYPVANGAKSTQSSVSTDLPKLPSAAGQKERIALSGSEGKWKGGEERLNKAGQSNVDKSENVSSPNTPQLNFTERLAVAGQSKGSNEIEMTEVLVEYSEISEETSQLRSGS